MIPALSLIFPHFAIPSPIIKQTKNLLTILNRKKYKFSYPFQNTLIYMEY